MMAKPMKTLELHYPMIQFLIIQDIEPNEKIWQEIVLLVKNISSHAHKTGSWFLLGVLFKIYSEHPNPFYIQFPSGNSYKNCH